MRVKRALILFLIFVTVLSQTTAPFAADVGNSTSSGTAKVPGYASPGDAAWRNRQNWTMWKVSIYVGKNEHSSFEGEEISTVSGNPLEALSLTEDFYRFGETFWLYEGETASGETLSVYESKKNEYAKRFWFGTASKEDYRSDFESKNHPGGNLTFNLTSSDSMEHRLFDVRDYVMIEGVSQNGYPPKDGRNIILPYVKHVNGNKDYNDPEIYDDAVSFFFCNSKRNWNCFLDFAAEGAGYTSYEQLLRKMLSEGKFTLDGKRVTSFEAVDPGRKQDPDFPGFWVNVTSGIAWVLAFEPVIVFYKYLDNGYNYYAMTVSDAAAAMISGCIALTLTSGNSAYTMENGAKYGTSVAPSAIRSELKSWSFISPFFKNLCRAVIPEYPWFGYRPFERGDYYDYSDSLLYYDSALLNGGIGFRYQAGGNAPQESAALTELVIEKHFSDNYANPSFEGISFEISKDPAFSEKLVIGMQKADPLLLRSPSDPGTQLSESLTFNGQIVTAVYTKILDKNEIFARCVLSFPDSEEQVRWFVREVSSRSEYDCVRITDPEGTVKYENTCRILVLPGNSSKIVFENLKTSPLTIRKIIELENGIVSLDYSDVVFGVEAADAAGSGFGSVFVDSIGNILNPDDIGQSGADRTVVYDYEGDPVVIGCCAGNVTAEVSAEDELLITINGIPDGNWKVREYFQTPEAAEKCYKVEVGCGENAGNGANSIQSDWVRAEKRSYTNAFGRGNANYVNFKNYVSVDLFNLELIPVEANAEYNEGTYVISSFRLLNHGNTDLLEEDGADVSFTVFCYKDEEQEMIAETVKTGVVAPAGGENLVWFMWEVPEDFIGYFVYCAAEVNPSGRVAETDYKDNGALLINTVCPKITSDTPDTFYERERPSGVTLTRNVKPLSQTAVYSVWVQEGSTLVRETYSVTVLPDDRTGIVADGAPPNDGGEGTIRSGNGFFFTSIQCTVVTCETPGCVPSPDSYTAVQKCSLYLPEYDYSVKSYEYLTLDTLLGFSAGDGLSVLTLGSNNVSDTFKKIHFIPVWYPDGEYKVVLLCSDVWTPAGMILSRQSYSIEVKGDTYDGWYTRN